MCTTMMYYFLFILGLVQEITNKKTAATINCMVFLAQAVCKSKLAYKSPRRTILHILYIPKIISICCD